MDRKNWKWMVPAVCAVMLFIFSRGLMLTAIDALWWMGVICIVSGLVCGIASVGNFIDYRAGKNVEFLERRQRALAQSQLATELEAARSVHPDSVRMILSERHRVWRLKSGVRDSGIMPHDVLYGAPDVTSFFLIYFLQNSSDVTVMPQHGFLVEGRKNRFDPFGAVDEYKMYKDLVALLERMGMIRKWSEFQPFEWVEPWNPALCAAEFGLEFGEQKEAQQVESLKVGKFESLNVGNK